MESQRESDRDAISKSIYTDKNYTLASEQVEASSLSETEQGAALKEIDTRARLAAKGEPEKNNPDSLDKVTTAIAQVGNNTLSLEKAKEIYNKNKAGLKSTTADELLKELNKEFDASVDSASGRVRGDVRLRAVGKSESALDRLIAALVGVKPEGEKALEERITTAREKFNLELDNFNRWEESQRKWRQANPDASPDAILREGMRAWFTEFAGKSVVQLRAETAETIEGFEEVRVESPDGRTGTILKSELKRALERGWKKL